MAIKQIIRYNSQNRYFAGFLNSIINEVGIDGFVEQKKNTITLLLDDKDAKKLETFSNMVTKYLPHSIFLDKIETLYVDEIVDKKPFNSPTYDIALCPRCLEELTYPSSNRYLDDTIRCKHYSNSDVLDIADNTIYSPHYTPNSTLLLCNSFKVDELFIITEDEKKVLFSIEKPTIKVTIKDKELREITGKTYINIKSPYNIKSTLLALNAKDSQLDYLFFQDTNETKAIVIQKNITLIRDRRVSTKLIDFDDRDDINRFLNISNSIGNKNSAIGAYLSVKNGISFMVSNDISCQKAIVLQDFSLEELLEDMKNNSLKSKLLWNFSKKYSYIIDELNSNLSYNLFETLSAILELDEKSFESLSDKSLEFRGNGGLKIDMNYIKGGFDYLSLIGSVMSFKLAGTDTHYLAYSIFEAFGDLTISTLNQLKTKFKIYNFIMLGDMFENSVLYSRILSKFALQKPYFSKSYALDD